MAKRFTKPSINWAVMEKLVPPEQRTKFMAFKAKSDGYLRRVQVNPEKPPEINWVEYKKLVPVEGLVDKFKEAYASFKVPYPEDTLSKSVEEQWTQLQPVIKEYCEQRQKDIDNAKKELACIEALPTFESMTMEMYAELMPERAEDFVKNPTFWPHTPEEQYDYVPPQPKQK